LRKKPFFLLISASVFAALIYLFAWSSIFSVSSIEVKGAPTKEATTLIASTSKIVVSQKLARVEPRSTARRIESIDWIRKAEVSRNWINGAVTITVSSRIPTAQFKGQMIDAAGKIFTLPGFNPEPLPRVAAPTPELGLGAIDLFKSLPQEFSERISLLSAINESNYLLYLTEKGRDIRVQWGKNEDNALKVEVFTALINLKENAKVRRVDLSAPHAPIVK
jgi:cell division septal protein FtsQ